MRLLRMLHLCCFSPQSGIKNARIYEPPRQFSFYFRENGPTDRGHEKSAKNFSKRGHELYNSHAITFSIGVTTEKRKSGIRIFGPRGRTLWFFGRAVHFSDETTLSSEKLEFLAKSLILHQEKISVKLDFRRGPIFLHSAPRPVSIRS